VSLHHDANLRRAVRGVEPFAQSVAAAQDLTTAARLFVAERERSREHGISLRTKIHHS